MRTSSLSAGRGPKAPLDIHRVMTGIREAVRACPPAALFQLGDEGYRSIFEQIIACVISTRTRDETTLPLARRLFQTAPTPAALADLTVEQIDRIIRESTFHEAKAPQIRRIAEITLDQFGGTLPADAKALMALPGVGPKCANLALGVATGQAGISVDIHVHRVTNRWGYIRAGTPEQTMVQLERVLPSTYWVEINRLLVPFGKHICTGTLPACSTCPVRNMCQQVGVQKTR